jgi:hypothetical protein
MAEAGRVVLVGRDRCLDLSRCLRPLGRQPVLVAKSLAATGYRAAGSTIR